MRLPGSPPPPRLTKMYGRGSLLAFLARLLAAFTASTNMAGWEESARRDMERDVPEMLRRGYKVAHSDVVRIGPRGAVVYRVTYERGS